MTRKEVEMWLGCNGWTLTSGIWVDGNGIVEIVLGADGMIISAGSIKVTKGFDGFQPNVTAGNHKHNVLINSDVKVYGREIK